MFSPVKNSECRGRILPSLAWYVDLFGSHSSVTFLENRLSSYLLYGLILAQIGRLAADGMRMERGRDGILEAYADIIATACGCLHVLGASV
jgi:hypothetical protein